MNNPIHLACCDEDMRGKEATRAVWWFIFHDINIRLELIVFVAVCNWPGCQNQAILIHKTRIYLDGDISECAFFAL